MRTLFAVVLLAMWPFHRHAPVYSTGSVAIAPEPQQPVAPAQVVAQQHECDLDDAGEYLFVGPDAMAGISTVSCDAAFEDWRHNYPPPALKRI